MTYDEQILQEIDRHAVSGQQEEGWQADEGGGFSDEDEMLPSAIEIVVETGQASTSMLQRRLKLGYARAARLMDAMEEKGIIGPFEGQQAQTGTDYQRAVDRNEDGRCGKKPRMTAEIEVDKAPFF